MERFKYCFLLVLLSLCSIASHAYDFEVDGLYYNLISASDKTCELVGHKNGVTSIIIPTTVNIRGMELSVVNIPDGVFMDDADIERLTVKAPIEIPKNAFSGCSNLSEVTLADGVKSIKDNAFMNCPIDSISIPNTVSSIGVNSINLVKNVRIEDGDSKIRTEGSADSMEKLYLGRNIIHGSKGYLPYFNGSQYSYGATSTSLCGLSLLKVEFGEKVTCLPHMLFSKCKKLSSIVITQNIVSIEKNVFEGCIGLKSVIIQDSPTALFIDNIYKESHESKYNSAWLEKMPYYYAYIYGSFQDSPIENIYIGRNITREKNIPKSGFIRVNSAKPQAFYEYYDKGLSMFPNGTLREIVWGNNVSTIAYRSFEGNSSITDINLPISTKVIEEKAFYDCSGLSKLCYKGSQQITIEKDAFSCCIGLYDISGLFEHTSSIGENAFKSCSNLKTVSIGQNTIYCGKAAFMDCSNLHKFEYNPGYSVVPANFLSSNTNLEWVSLGENIETIETGSFDNCSNISSLGINCVNPPLFINSSLSAINKFSSTLYIPKGSISAYEQANVWKDFLFKEEKEIPEYVFTLSEPDNPVKTDMVVKGDLTGAIINQINASSIIETLDLQAASIVLDNENAYYETGKRIDNPYQNGDDYDVYRNAPYYSYKYYTAPNTVSGSDKEYSSSGRLINVITTYFSSELTNANLNANLKSIKLPSSLLKLGEYAIKGNNLTDLYVYSTTPPVATATSFGNTNKTTCVLHVPEGCKSVYASSTGWKDFRNIVEAAIDNYIEVQPTSDVCMVKLARNDDNAKYQWYKYVDKTGKEIDITNSLVNETGWETAVDEWHSNMHEAGSAAILSYEHAFNTGDVLSFNWSVSSEDIFDQLQCYLGDELLFVKSGEQSGSFSKTFETPTNGKVKFVYIKDNLIDDADDNAVISNVRISSSEDITIQQIETIVGETKPELSIGSVRGGGKVFCIVTLSDGKQIRSNELIIEYKNFIKTQPTEDNLCVELNIPEEGAKYQWYQSVETKSATKLITPDLSETYGWEPIFDSYGFPIKWDSKSTPAVMSVSIDVENGDELSFYWVMHNESEQGCFSCNINDSQVIYNRTNNNHLERFSYVFHSNSTITIEFKYTLDENIVPGENNCVKISDIYHYRSLGFVGVEDSIIESAITSVLDKSLLTKDCDVYCVVTLPDGKVLTSEKTHVSIDTAIDNVAVDSTDGYNVYGINGILMLKCDSKSDLNKLPRGIYIVNGKKMIIK